MRKWLSLMIITLLLATQTAGVTAASLAKPQSRSVLISLIGDDGNPVGDAALQLVAPGADQMMMVRTNPMGAAKVELPEGFSFWVRAWGKDYTVAERPYVPATDGPVLTLRTTRYRAALAGLVTDDRGRAVRGAKVSVWQASLGLQATTTTDDYGGYLVEGLEARDSYIVQVEAAGFQPFSQGDLVLTAGARNQLDASLTPSSGIVTGEVVHSRTNQPISGVRAELILNGWGVIARTTTDVYGYFRLSAPVVNGGAYQVRLSGKDVETFTTATFAVNPGGWVNFSGQNRISLNPLYAELSGSVLRESGSPLPDTPLELQRSGLGTVEKATSDDKGLFQFRNLPAGTYRVRAIPAEGLEHAASAWVTVAGGDRAPADVTAATPDEKTFGQSALVGTVSDHVGNPVSGALVMASRGSTTYRTTTDGQGRYHLDLEANVESGVDPETTNGYHVAVTGSGFIPSDQPDTGDGTPAPAMVNVRAKVSNRADFTISPASAVMAGRVLNDKGLAVNGARVTLVEEGAGTVQEIRTDALGRYSFRNLPVAKQARYTPVVADDQYFESVMGPDGALVDPVNPSPGNATAHTLTVHPKTVYLKGLIKAGSDLPAAGASVALVSGTDGRTWIGKTNDLGLYELPVDVTPGQQYLFRASGADAPEGTVADATNFGNDYGAVTNMTLAARAEVTGQVFLADGSPVAEAGVTLWAEGESTPVAEVRTNEFGYYHFTNVAPGRRYSVAVWRGINRWSALAPGETILTPLVTPAPGATVRADLQAPAVPDPLSGRQIP